MREKPAGAGAPAGKRQPSRTEANGASSSTDILHRIVDINPAERVAAAGSFATFALVLGGYYLIRPVRENISAEATADQRQVWFLLVFVVMLAAALWFERSVRKMGRAGMEQLGRSLRGGGLRDYLGTTSDRLRERVRRDADDGPPPPPDA